MTVPNVKFNRRDNQLGIVTASDHNTLAVVGCSVGGTLAVCTPARFTRSQDVKDACGSGNLVEDLCFLIENFGIAPVVTRASIVTAGSYGTPDVTGVTGTSVVTAHAATVPWDDADLLVEVLLGGTIATGPISYRYSQDDGLTYSVAKALGTLTVLTIPETNAAFDLAAGTLVTGDKFKVRTAAPKPDAAALDLALVALQNTQTDWDGVFILPPVDGTSAAAIETRAVAMEAAETERIFFGNFRRPAIGESEATYKAAWDTAFSAIDAPFLSIGSDGSDTLSPITFARPWRPQALGMAGRFATTRPGRDLAAVADGAMPSSIQIVDANGNPKRHDERIFPGLDDSRASTYRSFRSKKFPGVYINNARVMSAPGSDIAFVQHRRISNLVCSIVRDVLTRYLSIDLLADATTGYILEAEALDVDANVNAALKTNVVDTRDATSVVFKLNRTDNALSTFLLKGVCRTIPLLYPKFFNVDVGFYNPALRIVPVAA